MTKKEMRTWVWPTVWAVLLWRWAAWSFPHEAVTDPAPVSRSLAFLGLWFVMCAIWVARRGEGHVTRLFAGYALASGAHWGGPIGVGSASAHNLQLALYVIVSTVLAQSLFLHLAWAFRGNRVGRLGTALIYLPCALGLLLFVLLLMQPTRQMWLQALFLLLPLGALYSLIAGGLWIRNWVVAEPGERRVAGFVAVILIGSWLPHAVVSTFGPVGAYDGLFNLPMAAIPAVLGWALLRRFGAGKGS